MSDRLPISTRKGLFTASRQTDGGRLPTSIFSVTTFRSPRPIRVTAAVMQRSIMGTSA